jgi:hypothetical protein
MEVALAEAAVDTEPSGHLKQAEVAPEAGS